MHSEDIAFKTAQNGLFLPKVPIEHREEEYDPHGFATLREMQSRHFWYRGRHRFLLSALGRVLRTIPPTEKLRGIDLGAGCGGWIAYLQKHQPQWFAELALADSSIDALEYAATCVHPGTPRYQIDLLQLPWENRWDVVFLFDVLEHIPDDVETMRQIYKALRPGGYLLVATPALKFFWTYNDDLAHHVRRYSRGDFARLAEVTDFKLCWSRYFMFFLSPLLFLSRMNSPDIANMSKDEIRAHQRRTHAIPCAPLNFALTLAFGSETPLGVWMPFPWGTSVLGVFQKPA